jgi:hypothetical protein
MLPVAFTNPSGMLDLLYGASGENKHRAGGVAYWNEKSEAE